MGGREKKDTAEQKQDGAGVVPRIRFPEFRGADRWKMEKLDNLVHIQDGFSFKSVDFIKEPSGAIQVIRITDINNKNINDEKVYIPKVFLQRNDLTKYMVANGDLLLSLTGAAGFNFFFWNSGPATINQRTAKITPKKESDFALLRLLEPLIHEKLNNRGEGQNNNLSKEFLNAICILIPAPAEQQKIATCLTSIDELIAAQAQKVEALKTHKKGLMQQLFPREGESEPRLRFPEFRGSGGWKPSELGSKTTKVGSGITPAGGDKSYKCEGRPFVRSQNVGWGTLLLEDVAYIDEETHASFDSTELRALDVLLNITGASIGRSAVADERIASGNVNQHVCIIRTKPLELNQFFLNQYLISQYGQKQIDSFQAGGNRQGLNFAQIRSLKIALPIMLEEQKLIASTLTSLDTLITTHTQKLESLKLHKRGLMQQLFPST